MNEQGYWQDLPKERIEQRLPDAKPVYSDGEAKFEADRCLYCHDAPCIKACPTEIDIPTFIKKIASENIRGSAVTILESNMLGLSCASVCPVEELCVGSCVYNEWERDPIPIGRLQKHAVVNAMAAEKESGRRLFDPEPSINRKVALIGAGPASLACSAHLALAGVHAVIFEKDALPGGLNTTGIAPYKMQSEDSLNEVDWILSHGVELKTGMEIGKDVSGGDLLEEYDGVFIGVGLGKDKSLQIPGEDGSGVYRATALIRDIKNASNFKIPKNVEDVLVVGGGNTAIDIARELAQLGVENVTMVYRRTENDMSGYRHEMNAGRKEGVRLLEDLTPKAVLRSKEGELKALQVQHKNGETADLSCHWLVLAIGQSKLKDIADEFPDVTVDSKGCIEVDEETRRTKHPQVYAGGDCINGGKEVVNAAADGREAAFAMIKSWR